jgi:hypothetical protein
MTFETKINELSALYLADTRAPDISGFVDRLFHVAADTGSLACVSDGQTRLRFFVCPTSAPSVSLAPSAVALQAACVVEHKAAQAILRMICARLGVICKERSQTDISLYGDRAVIEYPVPDHSLWSVSFTNTPDRQEFQLEAL